MPVAPLVPSVGAFPFAVGPAAGMSMSFQMSGDPTTALMLLRGFLGQVFAPNGPANDLVALLRPFLGNTPAGNALTEGEMILMLLFGQQMNQMQTQMNRMQTQVTTINGNLAKLAQALKNAGIAVPPELLPPPATPPRGQESAQSREADNAFRSTLAQIDAVQKGRLLPTASPSADPDSEFKRLLAQIDAVQKGPAPVVAETTKPALVKRAK
jgi:hypothetical protein